MKYAVISMPLILLLVTGCSYNHSIIKTYEVENYGEEKFDVGECHAWCNFVGTRDKSVKDKHRLAGPYYFTFNTRVSPDHEEPIVVSKLTLIAPDGTSLDLRPDGEPLVIDLRHGKKHRVPNSKEVNFGDRRVIYWKTEKLPFEFDPKNSVRVELEASIGGDTVEKEIIYKPVIKKRHKTPLNVFDNV